MMSATEDPVNLASAMPCGVLKTKNVAKKSTSKNGQGRNGSVSSGAPSPVSLQGSTPSSREPSPEKKVNMSNGAAADHSVPEVFSDISNDSVSVLTNGEGKDRKRPLEMADGNEPTKYAKTELDSTSHTQENISTEDKPEEKGSTVDLTEGKCIFVDKTDKEWAIADKTEEKCTMVDEKEKKCTIVDKTDKKWTIVDKTEEKLTIVDKTEEKCTMVDETEEKRTIFDKTDKKWTIADKRDEKLTMVDKTEEKCTANVKQDAVDGAAVPVDIPNDSALSSPEQETVSKKVDSVVNSQEVNPTTEIETDDNSKVPSDDASGVSKTDHNLPSHSITESESKLCTERAEMAPAKGTEVSAGEGNKDATVSNTFTLGDKEKDTIKEMLAAAVSRVGHECLESNSREPDTAVDISDCDIDEDDQQDRINDQSRNKTDSTVSPVCEDLKTDEPQMNAKAKENNCELLITNSSEACEESEEPTTSKFDSKPDDSTTLDTLGDSDALKEGSVPEISDSMEEKREEDLILLDGESDDNMDTIDDSILDAGDDLGAEAKVVEGDVEQPEAVPDSIVLDEDSNKDSILVAGSPSVSSDKDKEPTIEKSADIAGVVDNTEVAMAEESEGDVSHADDDCKSPMLLVVDKEEEETGSLSVLKSSASKNTTLDSTVDSAAPKPDVVLDTCLKRRLSSSDDLSEIKKTKTDEDLPLDRDESSLPSTSEQLGQDSSTLSKVPSDVSMDVSDSCEVIREETSTCSSEVNLPSTSSQPAVVEDATSDSKPKTVCSNNVVRISKQALERLIQRRIDAVLSSPNQSQMLSDMQHRIDYLNVQLHKWKTTAKNFQGKITELTALNRHDRRRSKGQCRHVAIQCDEAKFQAAQGQHITTAKPGTRPQAVSMVTSTTVSSSVAGGPQTLVVPVASVGANGSLTLLSPSNLPPASANLSNPQYRQNFTSPKKTVREMLDTSRADSVTTAATSQSCSIAGQQVTQTEAVASGSVKVIDLTEDEENSPARSAAASTVLSPSTALVVKAPPGSVTASGGPNQTILVPVTSCQPILLQSLVNQQLRTAQGTTLMYTNARPAGAGGQATVPSSAGFMPLTPGQSQIRPGHILVRQPTPPTVPASTANQQASTAPKTTTSTHRVSATTAIQAKPTPKHPAPLPPQHAISTYEMSRYKAMAPKPSLKISRVPQGIVLSWNMNLTDSHAEISNYQLFAYQEGTAPPSSSLWKKVGEVKALPLPMACTLTQFQEGNKYHFAVRAVDVHTRIGSFSDPSSIHLEASASS